MTDPDAPLERGVRLILIAAVLALAVGLYGINRCTVSPACAAFLFGEP